MVKFKIGDKVRVKVWYDMPPELFSGYGILTRCIGDVFTVKKVWEEAINSTTTYDIEGESAPQGLMVLEPEIESIIKVGQQLEFIFMEE